MSYYQDCAIPKPEPRKRTKGRKRRAKVKTTREVRPYVFARERDICRCCRIRNAQSMNEEPPRSCGGKVSKRDSMAVCGDGTQGCHGFITRNEIVIGRGVHGAEGTLTFTVKSRKAAEWCRVNVGHTIVSPVMRDTEVEW